MLATTHEAQIDELIARSRSFLIRELGVQDGEAVWGAGQYVHNMEQRALYYSAVVKDVAAIGKAIPASNLKALELYKWQPVGFREFVESPEYMNAAGELWPAVMDELVEINSGKYVEVLFTGGIGCYLGSTEFLTPTGWKRFDEYAVGDLVAQVDPATGQQTFVQPTAIVRKPSTGWWRWRNRRSLSMTVSPEHRVLWRTRFDPERVRVDRADTLASWHLGLKDGVAAFIPSGFLGGQSGVDLTDDQLRLMVAVLADGNLHPHVYRDGRRCCRVAVRKDRKKQRIVQLLTSCELEFKRHQASAARPTEEAFWFYPPIETKSYDFLWACSAAQLRIVVDELKHWDGLYSTIENRFHTTDRQAADFVQYAWTALGHECYLRERTRPGKRKNLYILSTSLTKKLGHTLRGCDCEFIAPTEGEEKFCFTVPTGFLVVRENGCVFVSGNSAKSTGAVWTNAFQLYLMSCLREPHKLYGQAKSAEMIFIMQSITATHAKTVDYARLRNMIAASPYFRNKYPFDRSLEARMVFGEGGRIQIVPVSSKDTAAIGQNVIGGLIDELNYMAVVEKSKRTPDAETYDQAVAVYNSIARRRKTRFMKQGKLPGILCLVSSRKYPGQFTDKKEEEARDDPTIYVYDKTVWQVKPDDFGVERFRVFVGDESRRPRILDADEQVEDGRVIEVPTEFRGDFDTDIMNALREIAGVATIARHPYIMNREAVANSFKRVPGSIFAEEAIDFVSTKLHVVKDRFYKPDLPRAAHIDLGVTGDSAGMAIGCVPTFLKLSDLRDASNHRFAGENTNQFMPLIRYDGLLEIRPPKGGEILFYKIRNVLIALRDRGLNIRWVTFDSYESRDSQQLLRQEGFITGVVSMDRVSGSAGTKAGAKINGPMDTIKAAFYTDRIWAPPHKKVIKELLALEKDTKTGKIDHPPNGSKDVADAMAGVAWTLTNRRELWMAAGVDYVAPSYQSTPDIPVVGREDLKKPEEGPKHGRRRLVNIDVEREDAAERNEAQWQEHDGDG